MIRASAQKRPPGKACWRNSIPMRPPDGYTEVL